MHTKAIRILLVGLVATVVLAGCKQYNPSNEKARRFAHLDSVLTQLQNFADTARKTRYDSVQQAINIVEQQCRDAGYDLGLAHVTFVRGSVERWGQNYLQALEYCNQAYEMSRNTNSFTEVTALLELGDIYRQLNKKRIANEYFLRAKDIAEKLNNETLLAITLNRLATIFYFQNRYDLALRDFLDALHKFRNTGYKEEHNIREQQQLNNIALCYSKLGLYDSALMYYDTALIVAERTETTIIPVAKGVIYGNIGRVYQKQGKYAKAVELLKSNIAINGKPRIGDNGDAVTSYTYLLEIYEQLDSNQQFENMLGKALHLTLIDKRNDMPQWRSKLLGIEAAYMAKLGKYGQAYTLKNMQINLQDSINKVGEEESLNDLILYNELSQQVKKVEELEEDNRIKEIKVNTTLLISILVFVVLIIVVAGLVGYRKNLKKQTLLTEQVFLQNEQITLNKEELEQAIEELKLLNTEKNRMLGMVAHDLRGPIYNITGIAQILESSEGFEKMDEQEKHMLELIKKSCENALEVINDLLEAAHIESGHIDIIKQPVDITEMVKNAIRLYETRAREKQIEIEFKDPGKLTAEVAREKISRVIVNLLSNAIKFSHLKGKITIRLSRGENNFIICVEDRGVGIKEEFKDAIYDKFTRAKSFGTSGEKPVGLGMSIVKQIVEAHNGRVWFESTENKGTTFFVQIPLK